MTDYRRGDIVLVNFNPQKRKEEVAKVRPAVIVSDTALNSVLDLVSVIALTTNLIDEAGILRVRIAKRHKLSQDSDAMVEQLRSLSKDRIGETIASLSKNEMAMIEKGIKAMLSL